MFEAVILAGGQGTRLKSVTGRLPKPMVDVNGMPFLYHLMKRLERQGCTKIVLSLCYEADYIVRKVVEDIPVSCLVDFTIEASPLGTGGAIKLAAQKISVEQFMVLNGDTLCELDFQEFMSFSKGYDLVISGVHVDNVSRYGTLVLDDDSNVISMREKGAMGNGIINSGIYAVTTQKIKAFEPERFSFEKDYVAAVKGSFKAFESNGYFVDIGVPEDYYKACQTMK